MCDVTMEKGAANENPNARSVLVGGDVASSLVSFLEQDLKEHC